MANTDNLDDFIKEFAKLEKAVELELIRAVRSKMRAVMKSFLPTVRKATPSKSGVLKKSLKIQSRSKRGISRVKLMWKIVAPKRKEGDAPPKPKKKGNKPKIVNYSAVVNFKKDQSAEGFATELWRQNKSSLDQKGATIVIDTMKEVLAKHGVEVK